MQNLCNIIKDLTGIKPGVGTVANMLHSAAGVANPVVDTFPQLLHQEPVVNCDETGADVNGKLHYVHVMCTANLTYYALSKKRGKEAMEQIGFLPEYKGIVEHDFWKSYFKATGAEHEKVSPELRGRNLEKHGSRSDVDQSSVGNVREAGQGVWLIR